MYELPALQIIDAGTYPQRIPHWFYSNPPGLAGVQPRSKVGVEPVASQDERPRPLIRSGSAPADG